MRQSAVTYSASSPRKRGPITTRFAAPAEAEPHLPYFTESTRRMGLRFRGDDRAESAVRGDDRKVEL